MKLKKLAFVCLPSHNLAEGQRMEDRGEVNVPLAMQQYVVNYLGGLQWLGRIIVIVPSEHSSADRIFIEDIAVFLPREDKTLFVVTNLAHPARQGEEQHIARFLLSEKYFPSALYITAGYLEGGDVLVVPHPDPDFRCIYIGISTRTDERGAEQLAKIARDTCGYKTIMVPITTPDTKKWLHLRGASSYLRGGHGQKPTITVAEPIAHHFENSGCELIRVSVEEHDKYYGSNCLSEGRKVLVPEGAAETKRKLRERNFHVRDLPFGALLPIDGAPSCCSKFADLYRAM